MQTRDPLRNSPPKVPRARLPRLPVFEDAKQCQCQHCQQNHLQNQQHQQQQQQHQHQQTLPPTHCIKSPLNLHANQIQLVPMMPFQFPLPFYPMPPLPMMQMLRQTNPLPEVQNQQQQQQIITSYSPQSHSQSQSQSQLHPFVEDHNILIPSDDPKQLALREWQEERQKLRIEDKRNTIARILITEEEDVSKELEQAKKLAELRQQKAQEARRVESNAAVCIQKRIRGYLTRKRYPNLYYNDIVLVKNVVLYALEKFLHELITEEFIPDILVELCDLQHYSLSTTPSLLVHKAKYHIINIVCGELINEFALEFFEEFAACSHMYGKPSLGPLEPENDTAGGYICASVDEEIHAIASEALDEAIQDTLIDSKAKIAFECIFEQVFEDMDVIHDTLLEELTEYTFYMFLDIEIEKDVKKAAFRYQSEHPRTKILISPDPTTKSTSVTYILDSIIDQIILNHLVDHVATRGRSFLEWDAGDQVLDAVLANVLLERHLSLREAELNNDDESVKLIKPAKK
ncbi:hypothetical protein BDR26DRAFT_871573 [Obelidium mucronatum]|nr:hypothetical protein BDR26DRAFT_871573 [Obelidium mucronatum]